jgi:hypothetical protein
MAGLSGAIFAQDRFHLSTQFQTACFDQRPGSDYRWRHGQIPEYCRWDCWFGLPELLRTFRILPLVMERLVGMMLTGPEGFMPEATSPAGIA